LVKEKNKYLKEHPRAQLEAANRKVVEKVSVLKLKKIVSIRQKERDIVIEINEDNRREAEELDGCYVVKTDVPASSIDAKRLHDRYKDLGKVEFAFRTMKTTLEKIRPIYVRKEERTRGHVFVAMLAYIIVKYITDTLKPLGYSREFAIESLDKIQYVEYQYEGKLISIAPKNLQPHQKQIIEKLRIKPS